MNQSWWKSATDVDSDQQRIYSLPVGGRHLVLGPPGSGKTNVLLLRGVYLDKSGHQNLKILTFSRSLVEFIRSGVRENGLIPPSRIATIAGWQTQLFAKLTGKTFAYANMKDHDGCRRERNEQLASAIKSQGLPQGYYDALLVDETQDLWADEVKIFASLSKNLFFVGDSRQRIYQANEGLDTVRAVGVSEHQLRFHYRIGRKICAAADRILPIDGASLSEFCQYIELALPSSVGVHKFASKEDQMRAIVSRIETQLRAYPDEWIGVLTFKNSTLDEFEGFVSQSKLAGQLTVHRDGEREFDPNRPIVAMTIHSAKGTEFRAVHILAADEFGGWYSREIGFTAITRAKTAVDCYFSGDIDGSLLAALSEERVPDPREVFP
jgi:superfamily I DNA/RNA helicase